jgi:hypothetical protein
LVAEKKWKQMHDYYAGYWPLKKNINNAKYADEG